MDSELSYDITYFEGIPREWEIKTLESVLSLIKDGTHNPPKRYKNGIKFIAGATDVKYLNIDFTNCTYISESDYRKIHKFYKIQPEDILLTIVGTIGNVAIVKKSDLPFSMQRSIALLRCGDSLHYKFLFYWLTSEMFKKMLYANVNPTAQPGIYLGVLKQLKIPLPSLREQQSIAKILSDLDEKIELNNKMNKTLEEIAQAIFKRWFIDFEFPNENGGPYKSSGGEMVDSELGMIPRKFKIGFLSEIAAVKSGKRPSKKNKTKTEVFKYPLVGASSINGYVREPLFYEPVIVIGRVGTHGVIQRFYSHSFPSDNTLVIMSKFKEFSFQTLKRINYAELNVGSTQPLITQTSISNIKIIIPPEQILTNFEDTIKNLYKLIDINNNLNENISKIRDLLLSKLMTGKIRVPLEDNNDK